MSTEYDASEQWAWSAGLREYLRPEIRHPADVCVTFPGYCKCRHCKAYWAAEEDARNQP